MMKYFDPERVERLISSMRESVRLLHDIKNLSEAEFLKSIAYLTGACPVKFSRM
ncbi:hypothetical protein ES703_118445 [subsurface metagenome]